jgi:hypothetical protein
MLVLCLKFTGLCALNNTRILFTKFMNFTAKYDSIHSERKKNGTTGLVSQAVRSDVNSPSGVLRTGPPNRSQLAVPVPVPCGGG